MPADRHFLYRSADDIFYAFQFDGTAVTDDNQNVASVATNLAITAAAASATRIFAFDNANDTVRVWDTDWNRQASEDFSPRGTTYRAMACSDTHLIMINSSETAEYYNLSDLSAATTLDQALGTGRVQGATFAGGFLFTLDDNNNLLEKRNANGTRLSPRVQVTLPDQTRRTLISTKTVVMPIARDTGLSIQYDLNLSRLGSLTLGSSNSWFAGLTTYASVLPPTVPGETSIATTPTDTTIAVELSEAEENRSPITRYEYRYAVGASVPDATEWIETGLDFTIENLQAETQYTIEARAVNAIGEGPIASATVSTQATPITFTITPRSATVADGGPVVFDVVASESVTGIAQSDFSVNVGTITALSGSGMDYAVTVTSPSTGSGTLVLTIAAGAANEGNTAASGRVTYATRPGKPVIQSTARQLVIIDTDYCLTINISGNPLEVYATGDLEGFEQNWDADAGTLKIFGRPDRNFRGAWLVHAKDRVDPTDIVTDDVFFDVVPKAPIFGVLPDIHLYREVPLNIDIPIENLGAYTAKSLLVGMKSEKSEEGVKIGGQLSGDTEYTVAEGDISIVAAYAGGVSQMRDFPIFIEEGAVPELGAITVTPKGNYAEVTFDELDHAIAYEWFREDIDVLWQSFSENRNIINPATVEIENGNLQATLSFQRVMNANAYQYRVNTAQGQGQWVDFVGTLANNMITMIIPDLEEGVTYTVQLRVSSPWIGVPISIQVTGGRLAHVLKRDTANSALFLFNTGVPEDGVAVTEKKIFLPTGCEDSAGIAVDGDTAYVLDISDRAIYVFSTSVDSNTRAPLIRKFGVPADVTFSIGPHSPDYLRADIAIYDDKLYLFSPGDSDREVTSFSKNTANGATATIDETFLFNSVYPPSVITAHGYHIDVDANNFYLDYIRTSGGYNNHRFLIADRFPTDKSRISGTELRFSSLAPVQGMKVIGDRVYLYHGGVGTFRIYRSRTNLNSTQLLTDAYINRFTMPPDVSGGGIVGLDILR